MALIAAFLSAVFSSSKDLFSKKLSFKIEGTLSAFASFLFALPYYLLVLCLLGFLGLENFTINREILILVFLRSVSDTLAELLKMHAIGKADISLISSVFALYPLILLFVSPLITGDNSSPVLIAATVIIVAGSMLLVWRSGSQSVKNQWPGVLLAVGSAFCFALNTSFDRLAAQASTPVFAAFSMTFLSCIFLTPFALRSSSGSAYSLLKSNKGALFARGFFEIGFMVFTRLACCKLPMLWVYKNPPYFFLLSAEKCFSRKPTLKEDFWQASWYFAE